MIERLSSLSLREYVLASAVLLAAFGGALFVAICEPQMLRLEAAETRVEAQRRLLDLKREAAALQVVEEKQRDDLRREAQDLEDRFFSEKEAGDLLAGLSEMAARADCRLVGASWVANDRLRRGGAALPVRERTEGANAGAALAPEDGSGAEARFKKASVQLSLVGRYAGVMQLLDELQSHGPKVHVGRIKMELVSHDDSELEVGFVVTVFSMV